ncbi:MAG: hypothetical protein GEV03_21465 [Streptosporangiales bacterium]|nr:hypothetical protein [Streptosporangiales bacterium]
MSGRDGTRYYSVADDELFTPGGRVVIRTYGLRSSAEEENAGVAYRTTVRGVRDSPDSWSWRHFEEARQGHRRVVDWLTGRRPFAPVPRR